MVLGEGSSRFMRRPGSIVGGGLVLLMLLAAIAYNHLGSLAEQARRAERGLEGLAHLELIRAIIKPQQEYRGLLVLWATDRANTRTVSQKEQRAAAVDEAFAALLTHLAEQGDPLALEGEITLLHREWQQLQAASTQADPEQAFASHTSHIARLLALHRRAVTSSGLDLDPVAATYNLIQILDLMLEFALEPTGQIRALYGGLLADPTAGERRRDQVFGRTVLLDSISARIEHHAAMSLQARPDLEPIMGELPTALRESSARIRTLLRDYPVDGSDQSVAAERFFAKATEIITAGYGLYDVALAATRTGLNERRAEAWSSFRRAGFLFLFLGLGILAPVGWGLASWREQERNAAEISRQSRLQQLVAETSARFLHASRQEFDRAINETLASVGEFFAVDRAYLFRYAADGRHLSNTHEWCAAGVTPQIQNLQELPLDNFPWWHRQLQEAFRRDQLLRIVDVALLPDEAANERETLQAQQVRSLCCVPIAINRQLTGFIGFDSLRERHWEEDQADGLLAVIGNLLSAFLERDELERELMINAITDGLTSLYNRRHFFSRLTAQCEEYRRSGKPFAVAMFDIDHFKRLNDTYGHLTGDCVLKEFATLLSQGFRAFDVVARYGGEEFAVMLIDADRQTAAATAQRILESTRRHHFKCEGNSLQITVSGGLVEVGELADGAPTPEALVEEADQRLYRAKNAGRDRVVWQPEH